MGALLDNPPPPRCARRRNVYLVIKFRLVVRYAYPHFWRRHGHGWVWSSSFFAAAALRAAETFFLLLVINFKDLHFSTPTILAQGLEVVVAAPFRPLGPADA